MILALVGVGLLIGAEAAEPKEPTTLAEKIEYESHGAPGSQGLSDFLRVLGIAAVLIGGGGLAIWKAGFFFEATGRHNY